MQFCPNTPISVSISIEAGQKSRKKISPVFTMKHTKRTIYKYHPSGHTRTNNIVVNCLSRIFSNSIPISHFHLHISSSLFLFLYLFYLHPSLSTFTRISLSSRDREREGERKRVGLADLALAIRLYGGRGWEEGVQACCGRNSVMNTYARVKW